MGLGQNGYICKIWCPSSRWDLNDQQKLVFACDQKKMVRQRRISRTTKRITFEGPGKYKYAINRRFFNNLHSKSCLIATPLKTKISRESQWLEDEFPFNMVPFNGTFGGEGNSYVLLPDSKLMNSKNHLTPEFFCHWKSIQAVNCLTWACGENHSHATLPVKCCDAKRWFLRPTQKLREDMFFPQKIQDGKCGWFLG